jgi:hypothetical protein
VVSYGGINEPSASYRDADSSEGNAPGQRQIELLKGSDRELFIQVLLALSRYSILVGLGQQLAQTAELRIWPDKPSSTAANGPGDKEIDRALDHFLAEKGLMEVVGARLGFRSLFF